MKNFTLSVFLLTLIHGLLPDLFAQEANSDPAVFLHNLEYRFAGPARGGRVTAVTGIPGELHTFFMGGSGGGVWKTEDAGMTWDNLSDGQIETGSIGAIAVAPSDPNTIYVGTGSACPRGNVSAGIGLYKSTDGGESWQHSGLPDAGQIGKIEIHPDNPDLLYVAALGQIFGKNEERGVFRSSDGGATWEKILFASDSTGAVDLAMNPHNPREIYAAMWRAERKPWTMIDGGPEGGIWKTTDGGNNWQKLEGGLPGGLLGRIGLAISPVNPKRIWALIIAAEEEDAGLWRSDDAGKSWRRICRDHNLRQRGWYYSHITADPRNENTIYVNNVSFWKSIDGGRTFDTRIRTPHGDHHGLWINPDHPEIMINCNDGGACVSLNGGKTWSTQLNQPTSEFYRVTVDNQFPYRLYAGQQDNTTISVPSYDPGSITETQQWISVGGSECADIGIDPLDPNIVWATSYSGEITITNLETGQERQVTPYPHYTEGTEQRKLKYRFQWNAPVLVSAQQPGTVYHTSNYVHRTTDQGQTWEIISPDLTRSLDQYHDIPGGPIQHDATGVEVYSSIFAFEESPHQAGELWAGTDDGRVHISRDSGRSWREITPENMPREGTVNKIELSAQTPGKAYIAVYNYRYNDFKPYIYRTFNYGASWALMTKGNGIPEDHFVRAIAEDTERSGLLFAGTEYGIYVSFDDGGHWQLLQLNLPHVPITDMEVHQGDLVISTQGRGFWILDDLGPLRQMNDGVLRADRYFFRPDDAYRTNLWGYRPKIFFYFKEVPEEKVTLEILDAGGGTVRTYSTGAKDSRNKLEVHQGLNSFSWDLRYEGPDLVDDLVTMVIRNPAPGPKAPPGAYTLRLTTGDWSGEQPLNLHPDPRWPEVRQEDYDAQLQMGMEVADMITDAHRRIENLRSIREQVLQTAELAAAAGHEETLSALAGKVSEKLTAVEDQLIQNKAEASQDNINYPRVFSNHIGRLYSVLTGDDHRPTGGAIERFNDLKMEYRGIVDQYDAVMENEVAEFNTLLENEKVQRIIVPRRVD